MAVLLLPLAAAAFSGSAIAAGGFFAAGTLGASALGLGASLAGGFIDGLLFPPKRQIVKQEGPRLQQQQITTSTEGAPIKRLWGRCRLGGQVLWTTRFRENVVTTSTTQRTGKSGRRTAPVTTVTTKYEYYVSFALGLCEGPVSQIGRIWADGKILDPSLYTIRHYYGTMDQLPDAKIEAVEGTGKTPAYRGIVYLMFDEMNLDKFGNRMPQITAEVIRPLGITGENAEKLASGVTILTGGEFLMGTTNYISTVSGNSESMNFINSRNIPSIQASLDDLAAVMPNALNVNFRVNWFGDDLRCQQCRVRPKLEDTVKSVVPYDWTVADISRAGVAASVTPAEFILSVSSGRRYHMATPADRAFYEGIVHAKTRGLKVTVTPVVELDIPEGNTTFSPYGGGTTPAYPSRDLITCNPSIGRSGTVDKTASAQTQVDWFFGDATPAQFGTWNGQTIPFSGTATDWTYRRMVLHYAKLCAAAGGVEAFHVGSGLSNLTKIRAALNVFPAVVHLTTLVSEVRAILPGAKVSYSAAFNEWNGHNPAEFMSTPTQEQWSETYFHHLDPLWSVCDYVGIEWFAPLTDWRSTGINIDAEDGVILSEYDPQYLLYNMNHGEFFDYRYTNEFSRLTQLRTDLVDSSPSGEDYSLRRKDIFNWWNNFHLNRENNNPSGGFTVWSPKQKQIKFTMFGCNATDKASNSPNSNDPPFSNNARDDVIQRSYNEAVLKWVGDTIQNPEFTPGSGLKMVDNTVSFMHCWDVRPYPEFPSLGSKFPDNNRYYQGQWVSGRIGSPALVALVSGVMEGFDVQFDASGLYGGNTMVEGYLIESITSLRDLISPLEACFFFDSIESEGTIKFALRVRQTSIKLDPQDFISTPDNPGGYEITRNQESDLPISLKMQYIDPAREYQTGAVDARRLSGFSEHTEQINYPLVLDTFYAKVIADAFLQEAWMKRENLVLDLPPSKIALDAGDVIQVDLGNGEIDFRINKITTGYARKVEAFSYDESVYPSTR